MSDTIALADYLLTRLKQLGIDAIHGVPGDYNLELLDHVEDQGFNWVGNCNELNAAYAADGYARVLGAGALITTFGVGELSALNGIAGAYAELAPVIHIVGTPKRHSRDTRALIHHTLNDGEYSHYSKMYESISAAQAILYDPRTAPMQIDTAIQQCLIHSRPVYITLPADMVKTPVAADRLKTSIQIPMVVSSDEHAKALSFVLDKIDASKKPLLLVDGESRGFNILEELEQLIELTGWPTWTTSFGKSCVNETSSNYCGLWKGALCTQQERDAFNAADLILCFGPHFSGTNTYLYDTIPEPSKTILIKSNSIQSQDAVFRDLPARFVIKSLLEKLDTKKIARPENLVIPQDPSARISALPPDGPLNQDMFYHFIGQYLREDDIILGETGTAGYGCRDFRLPKGCHLFKPVTWLSIGYMLPGAQGAGLAQRKLIGPSSRTILLIGDGSVQMTVQEISTIIRQRLNVLIIVLNNNGYTIERCLHGYKRKYNDIASWNYLEAPSFFGALDEKVRREYPTKTGQARTWAELKAFLDDEDQGKPSFRMVEAFLPPEDAPVPLSHYLQAQK